MEDDGTGGGIALLRTQGHTGDTHTTLCQGEGPFPLAFELLNASDADAPVSMERESENASWLISVFFHYYFE